MRFSSWWKRHFSGPVAPIEVFVRHCHYSEVSAHKARFEGFSREKCFENLVYTIGDSPRVRVTCLLDTYHPMKVPHFLHQAAKAQGYPLIELKGGSETASFRFMLEYVLQQSYAPETIIYFLEDDYLHRLGWVAALREALTLPGIDYVTLYDHKDKYFLPEYSQLQSKVFHTESCHWRTTPSTTNTYAMRFETLRKEAAVHRAFSLEGPITQDHAKFCRLQEGGARLVSAIPGFSTHLEPAYASPCTNWQQLLQSEYRLKERIHDS